MSNIGEGPDHSGGGPQGERIEGSLTDGGSTPGKPDEPRSFGAGRGLSPQGPPEDAGDPSSSEADAGPADDKAPDRDAARGAD